MAYEEDFDEEYYEFSEEVKDNINSSNDIELLRKRAAALDEIRAGQARRNRRRNARGTFELLKKFFAGSEYAESIPTDYWAWIEKGPSVSLFKYARSGFSDEMNLVFRNMGRIENYIQTSRFYSRDVVADEFPVSESYTCESCGFTSPYRDLFRLVDTTPLEEYEHEHRLSLDSECTILCCTNCQTKHALRLEVEVSKGEEGLGEWGDDDD